MKRVRCKIIGSGTPEDPYRVDLPTYGMVPGSWSPIIADKTTKDGVLSKNAAGQVVALTPQEKASLTCEVEVPDEHVDAAGKLDKAAIRKLYKGQAKWDQEDLLSDV